VCLTNVYLCLARLSKAIASGFLCLSRRDRQRLSKQEIGCLSLDPRLPDSGRFIKIAMGRLRSRLLLAVKNRHVVFVWVYTVICIYPYRSHMSILGFYGAF